MLTYKLNMPLYRTFWIRRRNSCQAVPACRGFIHHQTSGCHRHALAKGISFRIPASPPLPHEAPQGPTVGGGDSRGSPLPPTAAAPKCCSPRVIQRRQPSERRSAPGDARQEETYRIPLCARAPCIRWPSRWQTCWAPCSWRPSSRSRVPGGQGRKVVYTSLASCLPGGGFRRTWGSRTLWAF